MLWLHYLVRKSQLNLLYISDKLKSYIATLIVTTRNASKYDADLSKWIMYGASPRATLALIRCSKALAWIRGDEYVTPHHIQSLCPYILAHRLILSFEAEASGISRLNVINRLLEVVAVP